jgi:predicted nucleic acid-binding protein
VRKFVWDTSALLNLKESDEQGYSPAYSLWKDLSDGWIEGPYQNILPGLAFFELQASISRRLREGGQMLREFYILGETEIVYPIDLSLARKANELVRQSGFDMLRGADLIFACIAKLEDAWLVTLDKGFKHVADKIKVLDLNDSREHARYLKVLG